MKFDEMKNSKKVIVDQLLQVGLAGANIWMLAQHSRRGVHDGFAPSEHFCNHKAVSDRFSAWKLKTEHDFFCKRANSERSGRVVEV